VGDSVRVTNTDVAAHTFTGQGFDSGNMPAGGAPYSYRFTKAGTFDFVCSYHQAFGMTGTVTVTA
jgi:plastocyanin